MDSVDQFLVLVTQELLFDIVYDADEIHYRDLSDEFKEKTGHRPMDFFGFGNHTGGGWLNFIKEAPGLQGKKNISICELSEDGDYDETVQIYKTFNSNSFEGEKCIYSYSVYRAMLLTKCCDMIKKDELFANLGDCKDANGNTPLHLIAGLPGVFTYNSFILLEYLLKAGVDPFEANNAGQTFLHILFGRYEAVRNDDNGDLCFSDERISETPWLPVKQDKINLLNLLSVNLSKAKIALLAKAQDNSGKTVMHEYAVLMSTPMEHQFHRADESQIVKTLLALGASLRVPNNTGELPLHCAFNAFVFSNFLQHGAVCRARNDSDETAILFMLKRSVDFAQTPSSAELEDQGFVKTNGIRSVEKALRLLENLTEVLATVEVRETAWIPDIEGNVAVNIILIAIRRASYVHLHDTADNYRKALVGLLTEVVRHATSTRDMKRQNKRGQSFLHVLLDMGDDSVHAIIFEEMLLQSLNILLKHNVDVNAVDLEGQTPLDVAYKHPAFSCSKCTQLLIKNGAVSRLNAPLARSMSNLRIQTETRKLRSCPKRHLASGQRLTDPRNQLNQFAVVGKYRYLYQDPIGSGAFSIIFVTIKDENVDSSSGTIQCRAYALKRLEKAKMNPQEIKREITTLLSLSGKCENIINCHESVEDDFFQYLFLDLMDGDLNEFVGNEMVNSLLTSNPTMPVQVTKKIINGLAFLHENKFIHRDLKPGNILYTTDPALNFKIADFGLTKNTSALTTMTSTRGAGVAMAPGSRCWMAPELVSMRSRDHSQQSDVFFLGLVLHYLLTLGKHPFARKDEEPAHVIEKRIVDMQIDIKKDLHPEAISFLQIVLSKDPSKRPPATFLNQHPFLWSDTKKIEFLKAVGDQPEAVTPVSGIFTNSALEQSLQKTQTGKTVTMVPWHWVITDLFLEMTSAWKMKKYRTDKVIDLVRFMRNAYAHKQERSPKTRKELDNNIFLRRYPFLVLDVFGVVQQLGFDRSRSNILQALSL